MAARAYMWFANVTMTGQRCIDEVLLPHVRLFPWCCCGDKFVFMDDNATCHRTLCCSGLSRQRGYSTSRMASAFLQI
ncbi:hypothetical protein TNCV_3977361 [Trichonephila clavipes]|nr:hypothetical protein TNCV_3977361 [Trichonephila clavipes]